MKYDTVIFDLDGTLVNTLDDLADSVNDVMKSEGYPQRTIEEIKAFIGNGVKTLVRKSLPKGTSEEEVARCLEIFRKLYLKNMYNKTAPYEGIQPLLEELKKREIKIGVVSNKLDEATTKMCRFFFGTLVDIAVGDNYERKRKPAPDNVFEALTRLGSSKDKTIYVGDSNVDMETAKNAGLISVGVAWGYRSREILLEKGADYIIDKPEQLLEVFEKSFSFHK